MLSRYISQQESILTPLHLQEKESARVIFGRLRYSMVKQKEQGHLLQIVTYGLMESTAKYHYSQFILYFFYCESSYSHIFKYKELIVLNKDLIIKTVTQALIIIINHNIFILSIFNQFIVNTATFTQNQTNLQQQLFSLILMGLCANRQENKVTKKDSMESTTYKPSHLDSEGRLQRKSTMASTSYKINEQYEIKQALNKYFDQYDKDGDGHLSVDELRQFLIEIGKVKNRKRHSDNELVRAMMERLDKDGDGTISRSEFYRFYKDTRHS